jgi:hypothetical protein
VIDSIYLQRPLLLLAGMASVTGLYILWNASNREGYVLGVTRTLFFLLLAIALAGPFIQDVRTVDAQRDLFVLQDKSGSAELIDEVDLQKENIDIERRTILRGNNSRLASALDSELRSDSSYLLISDGRTGEDLGDVLEKYSSENSSISVLKPDMDEENAVYVSGPSTTVPGAATRFTVRVSSTTLGEVPLQVTMDNRTVFDGQISDSWSFNRSFSDKATHRIEAKIDVEDRYSGNDRFYKTVRVREKPDILLVGQESNLRKKLSEFYDIEVVQGLPEDLSKYYSVISSKALNSDRLSSYISRGNGYMYLGGYENPADYIPLEASNEDYDTESTRVIIAVEASSQAGSSIRDSKDIAYALVGENPKNGLPSNTKLGVLYYSEEPVLLSELRTLAFNRQSVLNKISRIEQRQSSRHGVGLKAAKQMAKGEGNIVIFTDGNFHEGPERFVKQPDEVRRDAYEVVEDLNVNLYVVGVGEDPNRDFLQELAERGDGQYYPADDVWRLGFRFGAGGGTSAFKPLVVMDTDHFITRQTGLKTSVSLFDEVRPRSSADVLVSGPGKREFLTEWNYGLGRVAAFSGGQPALSRLLSNEPGLVSRSASWTVGDPNRKEEEWIEASERRAPGRVEIKASYPIKGLTYSSEDRYTGKLDPEGLGFHKFSGRSYAYNYNLEFQEVGYREGLLDRIASSTGGEVYSPEEFSDLNFDGSGREQVSYNRPLAAYFLAAALVVFLVEVGYRKLNGRK